MKLKITLIALIGFSLFKTSIAQNNNSTESIVVYPEYMGVSKPLSEYYSKDDIDNTFTPKLKESEDRLHRQPQKFAFTADDGIEYGNDESTIQKEQGTRSMMPPLTNWAGQNGNGCPPDPTGAIGLNHYVQAVNATPFKVYNKTNGNPVGTVKQMGSLWNPAVGNSGDPIVLYDKYADRWFLAQFGTSGNKIYIAISTTNNPTGTYYTYTYSSSQFPDYLKFSIWADGYYMTSNQQTDKVFAFERDKMLLGQTARSVVTTFNPGTVSGFFCPMPADADGVLPPLGTPCPMFWYTENSWGSGATDAIKYINATVNWTPTTPTLTLSTATTIPTAAFDGTYNGSWNDIAQGSGSQKLDGIGGVLWFRAQWRQWTGYNTIVVCWGVKINSTTRSIKWAELRQIQPSSAWTLYQEGIYNPDALNRWVGSIAMDDNGSIALAYACSGPSPSTAVGLRYTGRLATDPLGQMSFAEATAYAGSGVMTGCSNRFGDYAHTTLDPSNGTTFWHTGQYVSSGSPATRIYSFILPLPTDIAESKNTEPVYNSFQNGNSLVVNAENLAQTGQLVVDLFDAQGKKLDGKLINTVDGKLQSSFDVSNYAKGIYLVRIGKSNTSFQKVIKVPVN